MQHTLGSEKEAHSRGFMARSELIFPSRLRDPVWVGPARIRFVWLARQTSPASKAVQRWRGGAATVGEQRAAGRLVDATIRIEDFVLVGCWCLAVVDDEQANVGSSRGRWFWRQPCRRAQVGLRRPMKTRPGRRSRGGRPRCFKDRSKHNARLRHCSTLKTCVSPQASQSNTRLAGRRSASVWAKDHTPPPTRLHAGRTRDVE
jgi:hypothetical protein